MINVILCDDNSIICDKYQNLLEKISSEEQKEISLRIYNSGEALIEALEPDVASVDIIYLDILMGRMNGIETAKTLRSMNCKAEIIFLTSSEEYIFDSFDTAPMHYLLKDEATEETFRELFLQAVNLVNEKDQDVYTLADGSTQISFDDILYFENQDGACIVSHKGGKGSCSDSLMDLEVKLAGKGFVKSDDNHLIHLACIEKIQPGAVTLSGGVDIPLDASCEQGVKTAFSRYLTSAL